MNHMFKKICMLSFWLFFAVFSNSCNKEPLEPKPSNIPESIMSIDIEYDKTIADVALAVHQSLDDKLFRESL